MFYAVAGTVGCPGVRWGIGKEIGIAGEAGVRTFACPARPHLCKKLIINQRVLVVLSFNRVLEFTHLDWASGCIVFSGSKFRRPRSFILFSNCVCRNPNLKPGFHIHLYFELDLTL